MVHFKLEAEIEATDYTQTPVPAVFSLLKQAGNRFTAPGKPAPFERTLQCAVFSTYSVKHAYTTTEAGAALYSHLGCLHDYSRVLGLLNDNEDDIECVCIFDSVLGLDK